VCVAESLKRSDLNSKKSWEDTIIGQDFEIVHPAPGASLVTGAGS
jgi:hypothetical protein